MEDQSDSGAYVKLMAESGATTFRDDFSWASLEATKGRFDWSSADQVVRRAALDGLHVLMIADSTPTWASGASTSRSDWWSLPPRDPSDYGTFAGALAARYGEHGTFWTAHRRLPKLLPAGIELWNEENTSEFWGDTTPDPATYAAMVKAAYVAVKTRDPSMTVILGGLAPQGAYNDVNCTGTAGSGHDALNWNPLNYLQALYADEAGGYFDALGWHPYNYWNGATAAQMLAYNVCSAWSQMASTPISARSLLSSHGDGPKTIWATETGVPTCIARATYGCVSQSTQASLATREVRLWNRYPWAGAFYWYDIRDDLGGKSTANAEAHFGAVQANNQPKPVYQSLKLAWRQGPPHGQRQP